MNVVDSCGWLEYFSDGPNAGFFCTSNREHGEAVGANADIVRSIKRILQQRTEADALRAIALIRQGQLIDLSDAVTLGAARLSFDLKLPLADSIILFSARMHDAKLWTQDAHFEGISGVSFVRKTGSGSST